MLTTRYTVTVPLALNDGTPLDAVTLDTLERELLDIGGGFTATDAQGAWRADDGTIYRDPVRVYALDIPDTPHNRAAIMRFADAVAIAADQLAVYVTESPIVTHLVTPVIPA